MAPRAQEIRGKSREGLVITVVTQEGGVKEPENGVLSILLVHEHALRKCYSSRTGS